MTWVRFHGELREGQKKGIPKASRFIYMELSHEARPRRGIVLLPPGMSDVDAVWEIVGGTRREVAEAVRVLTKPPFEMIRFDDIQGNRAVIVVNWEKWNPVGDDSTKRVRNWRNAKKVDDVTPSNGSCNALHDVTETQNVAPVTEARARASAPARANLPLFSVSSSEIPESLSQDCNEPAEQPSGVRLAAAPLATNVTGDGAMGMVVSTWADGVRRVVPGGRFAAPRGGLELQRLLDAFDAHCPHGRMTQERLDWARQSGERFARESKKLNGYAYADWLNNAGRESAQADDSPARRRLVPFQRPRRA